MARVNQVIYYLLPGMTAWRLSAAAYPFVGLGGGMVDEFFMTQMSEQNKTNYFDGTLKRVHTEVIYSSSDDELITNHVKKSKLISLKAWPRFLVIGSADDETLKSYRLLQSKMGSKA